MTSVNTTRRRKSFDELRKQIDVDPARRARVEEHKVAMLGELRRKLDLTQVAVADRLEVTQENVSHIERGEADVRLSTLSRYVAALGGRLELRAAFPEETVALKLGTTKALRGASTGATTAPTSNSQRSRATSKLASTSKLKRSAKAAVRTGAQSRSKRGRKG